MDRENYYFEVYNVEDGSTYFNWTITVTVDEDDTVSKTFENQNGVCTVNCDTDQDLFNAIKSHVNAITITIVNNRNDTEYGPWETDLSEYVPSTPEE